MNSSYIKNFKIFFMAFEVHELEYTMENSSSQLVVVPCIFQKQW